MTPFSCVMDSFHLKAKVAAAHVRNTCALTNVSDEGVLAHLAHSSYSQRDVLAHSLCPLTNVLYHTHK